MNPSLESTVPRPAMVGQEQDHRLIYIQNKKFYTKQNRRQSLTVDSREVSFQAHTCPHSCSIESNEIKSFEHKRYVTCCIVHEHFQVFKPKPTGPQKTLSLDN